MTVTAAVLGESDKFSDMYGCGHHFKQELECYKFRMSSHQCAFLTPADIQVFTNESKSKLTARCWDKTVTNFAYAVEQISGASEKLRLKGLAEHGEITDIPAMGIKSSSSGDHEDCRHLEDQDEDAELKKNKQNVHLSDQLHNLKSSIDNLEEAVCIVSMPKASGETDFFRVGRF